MRARVKGSFLNARCGLTDSPPYPATIPPRGLPPCLAHARIIPSDYGDPATKTSTNSRELRFSCAERCPAETTDGPSGCSITIEDPNVEIGACKGRISPNRFPGLRSGQVFGKRPAKAKRGTLGRKRDGGKEEGNVETARREGGFGAGLNATHASPAREDVRGEPSPYSGQRIAVSSSMFVRVVLPGTTVLVATTRVPERGSSHPRPPRRTRGKREKQRNRDAIPRPDLRRLRPCARPIQTRLQSFLFPDRTLRRPTTELGRPLGVRAASIRRRNHPPRRQRDTLFERSHSSTAFPTLLFSMSTQYVDIEMDRGTGINSRA